MSKEARHKTRLRRSLAPRAPLPHWRRTFNRLKLPSWHHDANTTPHLTPAYRSQKLFNAMTERLEQRGCRYVAATAVTAWRDGMAMEGSTCANKHWCGESGRTMGEGEMEAWDLIGRLVASGCRERSGEGHVVDLM